jgi:sulfide:quinone oxidoreductase
MVVIPSVWRAVRRPGRYCLEFGDERVATVDVTFAAGAAPAGTFDGPSRELAELKRDFGSSRIQRWFGHTWPASA